MTYLIFGEECFEYSARERPSVLPPLPSRVEQSWVVSEGHVASATADTTHNPCICLPRTTPAKGAPGIDHCADCCYGSLIEEYDFDCPIPEHREWAAKQFHGALISSPVLLTSAGGAPALREGFLSSPPGVRHFPFRIG